MISEELKQLIKTHYEDLQSYRGVARLLKISFPTVKRAVLDLYKKQKKRKGPASKLTKYQITSIKRCVEALKKSGERVTSRKVQRECNLDHVTTRTVRNHLNRLNYTFKVAKQVIKLTSAQRKKRVELATQWISDSHPWDKVVFTDEKRYNLDGPDSWGSYCRKGEEVERNKRQQGGGNVQVWGMLMPDHTLSVFRLHQRSKSKDYIKFLNKDIKPVLDALFDEDYIFQQDNASFHVSDESLEWMDNVGLTTMEWPARSPDLNIIENCWHLIASRVYDRRQFSKQDEIWAAIQNAVEHINTHDRDTLKRLRESIPRRLLAVIKAKGESTKY